MQWRPAVLVCLHRSVVLSQLFSLSLSLSLSTLFCSLASYNSFEWSWGNKSSNWTCRRNSAFGALSLSNSTNQFARYCTHRCYTCTLCFSTFYSLCASLLYPLPHTLHSIAEFADTTAWMSPHGGANCTYCTLDHLMYMCNTLCSSILNS